MKDRKLSFTTKYVLAFGLLMMIANTLLGLVVLNQSKSAMQSLMNQEMLEIVNTAAGFLDGDILGALTEEDVDGEDFLEIKDRLTVFQTHTDIEFIYAVRQVDEDRFVFTVDPDPVDPGEFGEEIILTDALRTAGGGTAAVDDQSAADRWGDFYSAYSPVFDSAGNVAGIVGIDFSVAWYEGRIRQHVISIMLVTVFSVLMGGLVILIINHNVHKRFGELDTEIRGLSESLNQLMESAGAVSERDGSENALSEDDEIRELANKVHILQKDMRVYERVQKEQYYRDATTGIPNLTYLKQFSDDKARRLRASGESPTVIYFDIRSMVLYNNEYGFSRGDDLLRLAARVISAAFPEALVGRSEGDHFLVVDRDDPEIEDKVQRINEEIIRTAYGKTNGIQGAAVTLDPLQKVEDGIDRARNTLKKIGDDLNVVFRRYSVDDDNEFWMSQYIVRHVEEALLNGWIRVFYQPILRTDSQEVAALEALARWVDPERGIISPGQFIPVLSRYHLLHRLDLYMVEQICKEYPVREEAGLINVPVSINFSAQDFDYIDVPEELNRLLARYSLPRDSVIVEITEQDLAQGTAFFKSQLRKIHENGYRLWIDDFGTGYSSLNVFSQYHVDRIKFDMDLVRHLDENNGANRIIMKSIVDMCRQMGVNTLAEGVETKEQFSFLAGIDCGLVQGFYFAKPEPIEPLAREDRTD